MISLISSGWVGTDTPSTVNSTTLIYKRGKYILPLQQPPTNRTFTDKRHRKIINSIFSFRTIPPTRPFLLTVLSEGKKANKGSAEFIPLL